MTAPIPTGPIGPGPTKVRRPGSGAIRTGIILLVLSFIIGVVGSILTIGQMDTSALTRDVVIDGKNLVVVPGRIEFQVAEAMSPRAPSKMTVAVLTRTDHEWSGRCSFVDSSGDAVDSGSVLTGGGYVHPNDPGLEAVEVAELSPGTYTAVCETGSGRDEPSDSRFTVGRVIGPSDLTSGELSPLLWFGLVLLLSGASFVIGSIFLIVGIVRRRRSNRGAGHPGPYNMPGQPPYPGQYGGPGPYGGAGPQNAGPQGWGPSGQPGQPPYPGQQPPGQQGWYPPPDPGAQSGPPDPSEADGPPSANPFG